MRKLIIIWLGLLIAVVAQASTPYCSGWSAGYVEGFCYQKYGCLAPLVPYCPYPRMGADTWQDGYNDGFTAGRRSR